MFFGLVRWDSVYHLGGLALISRLPLETALKWIMLMVAGYCRFWFGFLKMDLNPILGSKFGFRFFVFKKNFDLDFFTFFGKISKTL